MAVLIALRLREIIPGTHACAVQCILARPPARSAAVARNISLCSMEQYIFLRQGNLCTPDCSLQMVVSWIINRIWLNSVLAIKPESAASSS